MSGPLDAFIAHEVWRGFDVARLVPLAELAQVRVLPDGATLLHDLHPARDFHLLPDGTVTHLTDAPDRPGTRELATVGGPWTPVGWAGFIAPRRNTTTTVARGELSSLHWSHDALARRFYADPELAARFLWLVLAGVRRQLADVRDAWALAGGERHRLPDDEATAEAALPTDRPQADRLDLLRVSAFFASFSDQDLSRLASGARTVCHPPGRRILEQDVDPGGIHLMAAGSAVLCASGDGTRVVYRRPADRGLLLGGPPGDASIGRPVFSAWAGADGCEVMTLSRAALRRVGDADPEFDRDLAQRTLLHLANHLGALRVRHVTREADPELPAVTALLRHNASRLPVTSELHRLPTLLADGLTQELAFEALNRVRSRGSYTERSVAVSCEDMLRGLRAETRFHRDVLAAYDAVVQAPEDAAADSLREALDLGVARAFAHLDVRIAGLDNLPDEPGQVFMINHLACPACYGFPNGYHFSFDTALVSAMVLQPKYRASPIRVVRASPGREFGHNLFYARLGHISVHTAESGLDALDADEAARLRREAAQHFYREAALHLSEGRNLLICPEGSAQPGALSPAPFRGGAFRLAAAVHPQPLLVPIALANLDRRYKDHPLVALVKPAFRLGERVDADDPLALQAFLQAFREEYRGWIGEARDLARTGTSAAAYQTRSSGTT